MNELNDKLERIQTRIEMIRTESRILSYKIERMEQQRHELQTEKNKLKDELEASKWVTSTIVLKSLFWRQPILQRKLGRLTPTPV